MQDLAKSLYHTKIIKRRAHFFVLSLFQLQKRYKLQPSNLSSMNKDMLASVMSGIQADKSAEQKLSESTDRLNGLLQKVSMIEKRAGAVADGSKRVSSTNAIADKEHSGDIHGNVSAVPNRPAAVWDWASAYQTWAGYDDVDELNRSIQNEQDVQKKLMKDPNPMANHYHDHKEERRFFELPEAEKLAQCERSRAVGNGLYAEGILPKAAHQYKLALSYYDYCFPPAEEDQLQLDNLRHACFCNISCCYLRMGELRMAHAAASQVLNQNPRHVKALFRRARASRALDEYAAAQEDLNLALEVSPGEQYVVRELQALHKQMQGARMFERHMSESIVSQAGKDVNKLKKGKQCDHKGSLREEEDEEECAASYTLTFNGSDMPIEPYLPVAMFGVF